MRNAVLADKNFRENYPGQHTNLHLVTFEVDEKRNFFKY